jgi:ArsR family transcriptional regulator, arsenate/arsenite/antimonite-responsive transcriptional repressor
MCVDASTLADTSTIVNTCSRLGCMPTLTRPLLPLLEEPGEMCCAPLAAAPLTEADADVLSGRLKALADPGRLRLLSLVLAAGESCVCDLTEPLGLSQPTVSHHLKVLVDAGILRREKRGRWAWFSPVPGALGALAAILGAVAEPTTSGA